MKVKVLKLGTECRDKATELKGTLTHWSLNMAKAVSYLFQPKGLDEEGQPVKRLYLCPERLDVKPTDFEDVETPFEILGTTVTDKASGFEGMAVEFVRHINGCFHVAIQPKGLLSKKNTPVEARDFDLRGCVGKKIKQLSKTEMKKSVEEEPSPTSDLPRRGRS